MSAGRDSTEQFEQLLHGPGRDSFLLRLYVAGVTPRSADAIARIREICDAHLAGRYEIEVIDIHQQPDLAKTHQIVVTPTLIKVHPAPVRRLVGDLLRTDEVIRGLGIRCDRTL